MHEAKDMLARKAAVMTQLQDEERLQNRISGFQSPLVVPKLTLRHYLLEQVLNGVRGITETRTIRPSPLHLPQRSTADRLLAAGH